MDAPSLEKSSFESNHETRRRAAENYGGKDMTKVPIHHGHRRAGGGGVRSSSSSNSINRKPPQRESESVTDTEAYYTPKQRQRRSVKGIPARSKSDRSLSLMQKTPRGSSSPREHGLPSPGTIPRSRSDRNLSLMQRSPKSSSLEQRLEAGSKSAAAAAKRGDGDAREVKSVMSVQRRRRHHPRPHLSSRDASSRTSSRVRNNESTDQSVSTVHTDIEHLRRREGSRREQQHGLHSQQANGGRTQRPHNARPRHRPEGSGSSGRGQVPVGDHNENHGRSGGTRSGSRHRSSSPDRTTSSNRQHERPRSRSRGRLPQEEQTSSNQQQHERPRSRSRGRLPQEEQTSSNQQQHGRPRSRSGGRRSLEEQTSSNQQHERPRSRCKGRLPQEKQQNQKLDNAARSPVRKGSVDQRIPYKSPRPDLQNDESDKPRRTQPSSPKRSFHARAAPNSSPKPRTPSSEKSSPCTTTEHIAIPSLDHVQYSEESSPKPRTPVEDSNLIFKSSKSNPTELSSSNESSSCEEGSNNSYDVDDDATDDGTVLQFDPTQANNVYRVQQVSNAGSSYQVKNADGTCSTVQIAEIVDRVAEGILTNEESPIFDFLEDQDICPPQAGVEAPRMPTCRLSTQPPPSPHRAAFATAQEEEVEQVPQTQQRGDSRSQPKTHTGPRNPNQSGSGLRKKRPSGPDRQSSTTDESQEFASHIVSSGRRRQAPGKSGSENSVTRGGPHAAMKSSPGNDNGTTEKQTDVAVPKNSSRRIVGDAQNYSQFFSSIPRTSTNLREGGFDDSLASIGTDGYSVGYSVGADGVSAMNPPSLTEDERDSPPVRSRPRIKTRKKKPQHGPHGTPVARKPRTLATRDNTERSPNSESEFSDAHSPRERRMRVKQRPIPPVENGGREGDRQTTARSGANDGDPVADEPQTPGMLQAPPATPDCEGEEDTPMTASNKKRISMGLATSIGRYFSGGGRSRRSSAGTDVESSGCESEGGGSVLSSPGSRLFARKKMIQHHLLGDDSSSYESSIGSCGVGKIRT